jgi:hypothetical protein
MNENLTMKVADQVPFVAVAPDEICRINADGTTTYHWDRIEAAAQRWTPGCVDLAVCLAKVLLPLRPGREWQGLRNKEIVQIVTDNLTGGDWVDVARVVEQALKERNA